MPDSTTDDTSMEGTERSPLFDEQDRETFRAAVDTWGIDAQADMAEEEAAEFIAASKHYARGKVDADKLVDELADIRQRGFAFNDEEQIQGIRAVGAPIYDDKGTVLAAVSVSVPRGRMGFERFEEEIPDQVQSTANIIEVNLQTTQAEF